MIRIILLAASLALATPALAQSPAPASALPVDAETHLVAYTEVVPVAGATAAELYARAKVWAASTYNSTKDVIQADEKEAGVLVLRATFEAPIKQFGYTHPRPFRYTLRLAFKDGRYKYDLTEYQLQFGGIPQYPTIEYHSLEEQTGPAFRKDKRGLELVVQLEQAVAAHAQQLQAALKAAMQKPAGDDKEW